MLTGASLAFLSSGGHDGRPCPRDVPAVNAGDAAGVAEIVRIFGATPRVSNSNSREVSPEIGAAPELSPLRDKRKRDKCRVRIASRQGRKTIAPALNSPALPSLWDLAFGGLREPRVKTRG